MRCRHFNLGWGRVASNLWHFARVQTQFTNHLTVEVLPPYMPSPKARSLPSFRPASARLLLAGWHRQRLQADVCMTAEEASPVA